MTIIEFEMPSYHPKGCGCVVCQVVEAVLDELEHLRAENEALKAEIQRLQTFMTYSADIARLKNP